LDDGSLVCWSLYYDCLMYVLLHQPQCCFSCKNQTLWCFICTQFHVYRELFVPNISMNTIFVCMSTSWVPLRFLRWRKASLPSIITFHWLLYRFISPLLFAQTWCQRQRLQSSSTLTLDVPPRWLSSVHCWRPSITDHHGTNMEQFASWSDVIKFPANLQN